MIGLKRRQLRPSRGEGLLAGVPYCSETPSTGHQFAYRRSVPLLDRHDFVVVSRRCVAASRRSDRRFWYPSGVRGSLAEDLAPGPPLCSCTPHPLPCSFSC